VQKFFRKDDGEKQPKRFALIKILAPVAVLALATFIVTSRTGDALISTSGAGVSVCLLDALWVGVAFCW
jgi:hypothetical protein